MGREIRQVPANWNHPKNDQGHYIALHDQTYEQALGDWKQYKPDEGDSYEKWAEWAEDVPSAEWCRPAYDAPADHFQIYETVSEGTPVSPVFATRDELAQWLIEQGHSEKAARQFACENPNFKFYCHYGIATMEGVASLCVSDGTTLSFSIRTWDQSPKGSRWNV